MGVEFALVSSVRWTGMNASTWAWNPILNMFVSKPTFIAGKTITPFTMHLHPLFADLFSSPRAYMLSLIETIVIHLKQTVKWNFFGISWAHLWHGRSCNLIEHSLTRSGYKKQEHNPSWCWGVVASLHFVLPVSDGLGPTGILYEELPAWRGGGLDMTSPYMLFSLLLGSQEHFLRCRKSLTFCRFLTPKQ